MGNIYSRNVPHGLVFSFLYALPIFLSKTMGEDVANSVMLIKTLGFKLRFFRNFTDFELSPTLIFQVEPYNFIIHQSLKMVGQFTTTKRDSIRVFCHKWMSGLLSSSLPTSHVHIEKGAAIPYSYLVKLQFVYYNQNPKKFC